MRLTSGGAARSVAHMVREVAVRVVVVPPVELRKREQAGARVETMCGPSPPSRWKRYPVCTAILLRPCVAGLAVAETESGQPVIVFYESPPTDSFRADELLEKRAAYLSEHGDSRPAYFDIVYPDDPDRTLRLEYAGMLKAKASDEESLALVDEAINQYEIALRENPKNTLAYEGLAHAYVQRAWLSLDTWAEDHGKAIKAIDKSIPLLPKSSAIKRELQEWRATLVERSRMKPVRRERLEPMEPMSSLTGETPSEYGLNPEMDIHEFNRIVYNPQPVREDEQRELTALRHIAMEANAVTMDRLAYAAALLRIAERTRQVAMLKDAQDIFQKVLLSESNNVEALCGMAHYNAIIRNYSGALELLNTAHAVNPEADCIGAVVAGMIFWRHTYQRYSRSEHVSPEFRLIYRKAFEKIDRYLTGSELPFVRHHMEHWRIEVVTPH